MDVFGILGRVSSVGSISKKHKQSVSKLERRKQAAAIRDKKMYDVLDQKRKLGGRGASILVSLIPLSGCSNPKLTLRHLLETLKNDVVVLGQSGDTVHVRCVFCEVFYYSLGKFGGI